MKSKFALALLALSLALLPGCSSMQPSTQKRVETATKLAAYIGTTEYLRVHPEQRPGFELAVEALSQIETAPTVDLTALLAVVNRLPVKELKSDRSQMFITSAAILLTDYGEALPLERLNELRPVAVSIREGIQLALQPAR